MLNNRPIDTFQKENAGIIEKLNNLNENEDWRWLYIQIAKTLFSLVKKNYFKKVDHYAYLLASIQKEKTRQETHQYFRIMIKPCMLRSYEITLENPQEISTWRLDDAALKQLSENLNQQYKKADQLLPLISQGMPYEMAVKYFTESNPIKKYNYQIEADVKRELPSLTSISLFTVRQELNSNNYSKEEQTAVMEWLSAANLKI